MFRLSGILWSGIVLTSMVYTPSWSQELCIGLYHDKLFANIGMQVEERHVGIRGINYYLDGHAQVWPARVLVAVHPSVDAAKEMFFKLRTTMAVGPIPFEEEIGDDRLLWLSEKLSGTKVRPEPHESGSILFRQSNVIVWFTWGGPTEEAIELARRLGDLIQHDRSIAPRGKFDGRPEIKVVEFPANIRPLSQVRVVLEAEGFPANNEVEFAVARSWWIGQVIATPQEDKSLVVRLPSEFDLVDRDKVERDVERRTPDASVPTELILIAADAVNVFVTQKIEVDVILDPTE